jgi:hypothetical protein
MSGSDATQRAWARLAGELAAAGLPPARAALAAAVLVCRGRDPAAFATLVGLPRSHLAALEAGSRPGTAVPRRLVRLAPDLDWASAGVPLAADDPASRHPAAGGRRVAGARAGHPP